MSVLKQSQLLSLNRSSLYYNPKPPSEKEIILKHEIDRIYTDDPYFGSRTITTVLNREGFATCRNTVSRYMREMGLTAIYPKPNLSKRNHEHKVFPYLLRNITASYPNHIWLDETYYSVIRSDAVHNEDGKKLRGISKNQLCIGVATDKAHTLFIVEGYGKPSQKKTFETFHNHITPGSTLIHDKEKSHAKLIKRLFLQSTAYASEELKGLPDKENPLEPVNRQQALMKHFLNSHAGFLRENLQGYLDLFSYVTNPPYDLAEKVDNLLNLAFQNPKSLRYRDFYQAKSSNVDF